MTPTNAVKLLALGALALGALALGALAESHAATEFVVDLPLGAGINGRYWYLFAISPGEVVSVNTDLTKDECEHAMSILINDKHWPHADCNLQNPPPPRTKRNTRQTQ